MENGPARRTRSTTQVTEVSESPSLTNQVQDLRETEENFKTPAKPKKQKVVAKKSRTPSGQPLSSSVKDIRNFFQYDESPERRKREQSPSPNRVNVKRSQSVQIEQLCEALDRESIGITCESNRDNQNISGARSKTNIEGDQTQKGISTEVRSKETISVNRKDNINSDQTSQKMSIMEKSRIGVNAFVNYKQLVRDQKDAEEERKQYGIKSQNLARPEQNKSAEQEEKQQQQLEEQLKEACTEGASNPKTMDIQLVLQMFREIKQEMKGSRIENGKERLENVEQWQQYKSDKVQELEIGLSQEKAKNEYLRGAMKHMCGVVDEVERCVQNLEANYMKKAIVISGLIARRKKRQCIEDVEAFFYNQFGIEIEIDDCFHMSPAEHSPIAVFMVTSADKRLVFQNMEIIKQLKNKDDKSYFINDYLPAAVNEKKRREREIYAENANVDVAQQKDMELKAGKHYINEEKYVKKITEPKVQEILEMTNEEVNEVMEMKIVKGEEVEYERNIFVSYSGPVNNHEQVRKMYLKMKLCHADAKHIVGVFRVPGNDVHHCEDFCDDGEHGVGKSVLHWMIQNNIKCRAIFIVRYQMGEKIGSVRFAKYVEAAESAIRADPFNQYTGDEQTVSFDYSQMMEVKKRNRDSRNRMYNGRGRGGGGSRGGRGGRETTRGYRKSLSKQRGAPGQNRGQSHWRTRPSNNGSDTRRNDREHRRDTDYRFTEPKNALNSEEWPRVTQANRW